MPKTKLSACGVIIYQGRFLIVKRSSEDDFLPNCWEFPGGSVKPKETVENALIREIKEETGIDIGRKKGELIGISEEFMNKEKTQRYLQLNFKIELTDKSTITLSPEHVEFDWASPEDPRLDDFLKNIVKQIKDKK